MHFLIFFKEISHPAYKAQLDLMVPLEAFLAT